MEDMYTSEEKKEWRKCVLWSPIHPVTWFFPFIGHIGIADSQGNVYDFQGTYSIGKNHLLFGYPTKYYRFAEAGVNDEMWDEAVQKAIRQYKQESYNLWSNNCHSFVAYALNYLTLPENQSKQFDIPSLASFMFIKGRFLSLSGFLWTWIPFILFVIGLVLLFKLLSPVFSN